MSSTKQAATPNVAGQQLQVTKDFSPTEPPQQVTDSDNRASCLRLSQSTAIIASALTTQPGQLGINTTPSYALHVGAASSVRFELDAKSKVSIGGEGVVNVDAPSLEGGRFTITNSGRVGIKKPNPDYELDVTGAMRITGVITAGGINLNGPLAVPGMKSVQALDGLKPLFFNPTTGMLCYLV